MSVKAKLVEYLLFTHATTKLDHIHIYMDSRKTKLLRSWQPSQRGEQPKVHYCKW